MKSTVRRTSAVVAIAVVALAIFLRFETLGKRPLWSDEIETYQLSLEIQSLGDFFRLGSGDEFEHPPLHPLVVSWFNGPRSSRAFDIRLPSAIAGTLSVPLLMWIGTLWFGRRVGITAGFLLAISVYQINYSQDARAYALMVALMLGQYVCLHHFLFERRSAALVPFVALGAMCLYLHHLGTFTQLGLAITFALYTGLELFQSRRDSERARAAIRRLGALAAAYVAMGAIYTPQLILLFDFLGIQNTEVDVRLDPSLRFFHELFTRWGNGLGPIVFLYETVFALGVWKLGVSGRFRAAMLIWFVCPFVLFTLIPSTHFFDIRYVMAALPAFILIGAQGIIWLAELAVAAVDRISSSRTSGIVAAGALGIVLLPFSAAAMTQYLAFRKTEIRCSQFFLQPEVLEIDNGFCRSLILNTNLVEDRYILRLRRMDSFR